MNYLELEYTKSNVRVIERSGCGNCDQNNPILFSGKPELKGNTILLHNHRYPQQIVAEMTLESNGSIAYQYTDQAGDKLNLTFKKDAESFSVNRMLRKLGFPSSLTP